MIGNWGDLLIRERYSGNELEPGEVKSWLESGEGEMWSRWTHNSIRHHAIVELLDDRVRPHAIAHMNFGQSGCWWHALDLDDSFIRIDGSDLPPEHV
jgi:hypothetical protein